MDVCASSSKRSRTPSPNHRSLRRSSRSLGRQSSQPSLTNVNTQPPTADIDDPSAVNNSQANSLTATFTRDPMVGNKKASFLLRSSTGSKVFSNPARVSRTINASFLGKYVLEGETRTLGDGATLVIAVWEHNLPKVPQLEKTTFSLGEWPVICRRADRDGDSYNYGKVGPMGEDTDLEEARNGFRVLEGSGGDIVDISWVPSRHLPRNSNGKWLRLKVRGPLPTKVLISQVVYYPKPFHLPILRCPRCLRLGHSINTCHSAARCSRCSGPHSPKEGETSCINAFRCFQCGGAHGPRSVHCSHNQQAQQMYSSLVESGTPLHIINKKLRELQYPGQQKPAHRQPVQSLTVPTAQVAQKVQLEKTFASVLTGNKYAVLSEDEEEMQEEEPDLQPVEAPNPLRNSNSNGRNQRTRVKILQRRKQSSQPDPLSSDITVHNTTVEIHHPPTRPSIHHKNQHSSSSHPSQESQDRPKTRKDFTSTNSSINSIMEIYTIVKKGLLLYEQGTPLTQILSLLWPSLSALLSLLLQ